MKLKFSLILASQLVALMIGKAYHLVAGQTQAELAEVKKLGAYIKGPFSQIQSHGSYNLIWIERNGRIKSLQELNDKLVLTNQLLSEDCTQLQEQVSAYELNQKSAQLQGTELQDKLREWYKCIQTGCGKVQWTVISVTACIVASYRVSCLAL